MIGTISNLNTCVEFIAEMPKNFIIFSDTFVACVALFFGLFVHRVSGRTPLSRLLLSLITVFAFWSVLDLVTWISSDSSKIMFAWGLLGIFSSSLAALCVVLVEEYLEVKSKKTTVILLALLISPVIIFMASEHNLVGFDATNCESVEGWLYSQYYYYYGLAATFWIILRTIIAIFSSTIDKNTKKRKVVFSSAVSLFAFSFYLSNYLSSYFGDYNVLPYGQIGMLLLVGVISYLIVNYGVFNIRILATQILIWALVLLVSSQFFFVDTVTSIALNLVTLLGAIISGVLIVRSVKRLDIQREQLALANREQETLVHFITHQIKGFFTKSRNIFDTLSDTENMPEGAQRLITEGLRSDKEGVELVENILNAANLKNGKLQFTDKQVDLDLVVKKVLEKVSQSATAKNLKLNYYCSTPVPFVGDEFRLKDVFKNLISNSINYTFEGGITIYLNKKPDRIEFIVKDTGVGLTEDDKKKLFTSGGRGTESLKYNVSSTGYGLFIVQKIVSYYKGRIWAESEGRGKGSIFTLVLPLNRE